MNFDAMAQQFLRLLLERERARAVALVEAAVADDADIRDVYLKVFEPVLYEVGARWERNQVSVAQEHYATAVVQLAMSRLYGRLFEARGPANGRALVACCVEGELHEVGVRMVADFFELAGWNTHYLGASTPGEGLLDMLRETGAQLLCVSASMDSNLERMRRIVESVRGTPETAGTVILVGGAPFRRDPALAEDMGADGWAHDAAGAVALGESLCAGRAADV